MTDGGTVLIWNCSDLLTGHLDNLGLIELLRRECKFMVLFDAGHDPSCTCEDLSYVLGAFKHKCVFTALIKNKQGKDVLVSVEKAINNFRRSTQQTLCIRSVVFVGVPF